MIKIPRNSGHFFLNKINTASSYFLELKYYYDLLKINKSKYRGIYSGQFAELGKGGKISPLNKKGEKFILGNDNKKGIKRKRGKKREKEEK